MATLQQQLSRAQKLTPQYLTNLIFDFLRTIERELVLLNRQQLHENSQDIFGKPLGTYSEATEFITTNAALLGQSVRIKKAGDPYDFLQTGTFLDSIFVNVSNGFVHFGSHDPKTDEVLGNPNLNSKEFFGLTELHQKQVIIENILPHFIMSSRLELQL